MEVLDEFTTEEVLPKERKWVKHGERPMIIGPEVTNDLTDGLRPDTQVIPVVHTASVEGVRGGTT